MTQPIDEAELRLPPRTVEIYSLFKKKDTAVLTDKDYAKLLKWVEVYTTQAVTAALKRTDAALPEKGNLGTHQADEDETDKIMWGILKYEDGRNVAIDQAHQSIADEMEQWQ